MYLQTGQLAIPIKASTTGNVTGVPSGLAGELLASELTPRYSNLAKLGKIFIARGALQTLSASGTAMTGLILWNGSPAGNGVDLHLLKIAGDVAVTSAALTGIALAYTKGQTSAPTTPTAAPQTSTYLTAPNGAGLAYTAGTVVLAPTVFWDVMHNTVAIGATGEDMGFYEDLEGSIIVPPQTVVCFAALGAASAASAVNLDIMWAELPA
jgi:hypothetical protein